jgi:hypothetical protein
MKWLETTCMAALGLGLTLAGAALSHAAPPKDPMACVGVPEVAADGSPLMSVNDIRTVQEVRPATPVSETETTIPRGGARILLRAEPGMTAEWLQRIADCHTAKVAASDPATLTSSPLDVKGALVTVQSTGNGFSVDITSPDVRVSKVILERARAVKPLQPVH